LVESYKKYNGMDDLQEETNVTCKCSIFWKHPEPSYCI
jgi:hypothetical protein